MNLNREYIFIASAMEWTHHFFETDTTGAFFIRTCPEPLRLTSTECGIHNRGTGKGEPMGWKNFLKTLLMITFGKMAIHNKGGESPFKFIFCVAI